MIRRPPRSTLFPTRRSSDLSKLLNIFFSTVVGQNLKVTPQEDQSIKNQVLLLMDEFTADRKSTRLNSSHPSISYAVFCLKKKRPPTARERPAPCRVACNPRH